MATHTPGPWIVEQRSWGYPDYEGGPEVRLYDVRSAKGLGIASGTIYDPEGHNARLIAAAPELLGQHEANLADLDFLLRAIGAGDPMPELAIRVSDLIRHTRAAIAKATQP